MNFTTNYLPDVKRIKKKGISAIAIGKWALDKKRRYAQAAQILVEKVGCEMVTFPGHYVSFWNTPDERASTLHKRLHKAEVANQ